MLNAKEEEHGRLLPQIEGEDLEVTTLLRVWGEPSRTDQFHDYLLSCLEEKGPATDLSKLKSIEKSVHNIHNFISFKQGNAPRVHSLEML